MALTGSSSHNFTVLVAEVSEDGYDTLVADIWVGVVLTLMVLSCVCCVCSCLLYHKFQQWKRSVLATRVPPGESTEGPYADVESLPSYTIVSGLPSYEEALIQLRLARERRASLKSASDLERRASLKSASELAAAPPVSPVALAVSASPTSATVAIPVPPNATAPSAIKLSVAEFFQAYKTYPPM